MSDNGISIPVQEVRLAGELNLSDRSLGLVVFAHGSGSSRHSPRNQYVARLLRAGGLGTFLFDLLTREEEQLEARTRHLRFDIPFLAKRLVVATRWVLEQEISRDINVGFFGSSTGAAAALVASAELVEEVRCVVSRGGRPDLAGESLLRVTAPTLLIVGGEDKSVIELNEEAYGLMKCERALRILPGASHLFEEPGALESVARMASDWFVDHLQPMARLKA